MRVLQIGGTLVGAQKHVELGIHDFLRRTGQESMVLYAIGEEHSDPGIVRYETRPENILRRALWKYCGHDDRCAWLQTRRIIRILEGFRPDVVHLHVVHHGYVHFAALMRCLCARDIPVVYTMHDLWALTGGCYHYTSQQCEQYRTGCTDCPSTQSDFDCRPDRAAQQFRAKRAWFARCRRLAFAAVSGWVAQQAQQAFDGQYPVCTIYNGVVPVPEEELRRAAQDPLLEQLRRQAQGKTVLLGVAAGWTEQKGLSGFIELARLLGERYLILLAGGIAPDAQAQLPDNVRCLGYVRDRALLWNLYRLAHLHVSMSLEETFGMTFVEAALNGVRSAGFASTAVEEILAQVQGIAVKELTAEAMAGAILARQPERLSPAQVQEIRRKFSQDEMARRYAELYAQLCREPDGEEKGR